MVERRSWFMVLVPVSGRLSDSLSAQIMNETMVGRFLLLLCDSNHAVCIIVVGSIAATPGSLHGPSVRVTQTRETPFLQHVNGSTESRTLWDNGILLGGLASTWCLIRGPLFPSILTLSNTNCCM